MGSGKTEMAQAEVLFAHASHLIASPEAVGSEGGDRLTNESPTCRQCFQYRYGDPSLPVVVAQLQPNNAQHYPALTQHPGLLEPAHFPTNPVDTDLGGTRAVEAT